MLKLGDKIFNADTHRFQHSDGYLKYEAMRQSIPNLESSPVTVGYQNRFYPPPPSYATETAAIYHRMIHDAYQFVYGIYGEVDAYQSLTGGSFTKIIHRGKGDAHYVALMRPGTPDPGGFGYEAAMFTNGGNGFIATLQGQLGFPDSEPNQNNAVGFQALWGDDGVDPGFIPNYGMFYANNSPGHAFMARLNQFADQGVPQIMVTEPSFRIRHAIYGSGATHLYGDAATAGDIDRNSPDLVLRGHFWDGTNSISIERQSLLRTVVSATGTPQLYYYYGTPGAETLGMISDAYGLNLQGNDITSVDDITFSVGGGSLVDLQGGRITGGGSAPLNLGGAATTSHGLGAGSVLIGGALEVNGLSYFDLDLNVSSSAIINIATDSGIFFGNSLDVVLWYTSTHTPDTFVLGLPSTSRAFVIAERGDFNFDFAHPLQSDPTVFIHSTSNVTNQWIGLTHDKIKGRVTTGFGVLNIGKVSISSNNLSTGSVVVGDHLEVDGHIWADGYITTGSGNSLLLAPADGYVNPVVDDGYSLGSQTKRWKDLWLGPDSLHLYQPASEGPERDWNIRLHPEGDLWFRQSNDSWFRLRKDSNNLPTLYMEDTGTITLHQANSSGVLLKSAQSSFGFKGLFLLGETNSRDASLVVDGNMYIANGGGAFDMRLSRVAGEGFNGLSLSASHIIGWSHSSLLGGGLTTKISKHAPGVLKISDVDQSSKYLMIGHNSVDGYIGNETGNLRLNSNGRIILEPLDGYVVPFADDAYSLGSPTQRWKELWLGPDSLHIRSDAAIDGIISRDWDINLNSSGDLGFRQGDTTWATIDDDGVFHLGGGVGSGIRFSKVDASTFRVVTANGATNFLQIGTTGLILLGGTANWNSNGLNTIANSWRMWITQSQDSLRDVRLIGSADAVGEYAARIGTKYTAGEGGNNATLLQIGLDIDGSPVATHEFYGDGRFATMNSGHAIILRHTGQDGYIQTTLGHISLAPQDGYVNPMTDDAYSLGSPTQRWKELWLGPNSLHIRKPADANGIERDWRLGIGDAGSFVLKQGNDQGMLIAPTDIGSVTLGYGASASTAPLTVAIGALASATNINGNNTVIGYNARAQSGSCVVIGTNAIVSGTGASSTVVIGPEADGAASQCVVLGYTASISTNTYTGSVAIGYNSSISGSNAIAIGSGAGAAQQSLAIGHGGTTGTQTVALGIGTANGSANAVVLGYSSQSAADQAVAIGSNSLNSNNTGNGTGGIAIGYLSNTDGGGIAIGWSAKATNQTASRSIAIGYNANTQNFTHALAFGENATVAENNQAQFGTIAQPLNTVIYGNYLSLNNNNKSIILRHVNNDGYIQTTSGHLILSPADGEVVPAGDAYGFGNPNNRWYDGYFVDTNTRGFVADIVNIIAANSPYTAKQFNYTIIADAVSGNITINLPGAGGANRGRIYNIKKVDATGNTVTIQGSGAQTIDGSNTLVINTQYVSRTIQSDGTQWWVI